MREIPSCLNRRYQALDNLIEDLSTMSEKNSHLNGSNTHGNDPGIKLMCQLWNILKEDPDCNLQHEVRHSMGLTDSRSILKLNEVTCYMAHDCSRKDDKKKPSSSSSKSKDPCCQPEESKKSKCCSTSKSNTPSGGSSEALPLSKVLCNLKEAASFDKKCNAKLAELMATEKTLQDQIQRLENRESEGVKMLKQADCMWSCMEDSYKEKVAESVEKQKTLLKQFTEVETSTNKWRKNMKDLEVQLKNLNKFEQEIKEKINQKQNDAKCIDREIADFKKRIESNKKDTEIAKNSLAKKKKASDSKMASIASEIKRLERLVGEESQRKNDKEAEGTGYVKDAREDLQKICRVLLTKKLENEDLLAEKEALHLEINLLKQTCDQCKEKCKSQQQSLMNEISKTNKEINEYKIRCIKCHVCTDTADARRFCTDCPRCMQERDCLITEGYCEHDPAMDCVCVDVKQKFLDNVFDNMYTVLERQTKTAPGKAVAQQVLNCLKRSRNGKLNDETRRILQDFILTTVKKNLNLTIVGGAVKTRCEMDSDTYKQLMLCLKDVKATKPEKADKGTVSKREACRRWGGPGECNCPGGPKTCICTRKAPAPPHDPTSCPPLPEDPEDAAEAKVCPHKENTTCGADCGMHTPGGANQTWQDDPCADCTSPFPKNMRAAQCVLGPEPLKSNSKCKEYMTPIPFVPNFADEEPCSCKNEPPIPSTSKVKGDASTVKGKSSVSVSTRKKGSECTKKIKKSKNNLVDSRTCCGMSNTTRFDAKTDDSRTNSTKNNDRISKVCLVVNDNSTDRKIPNKVIIQEDKGSIDDPLQNFPTKTNVLVDDQSIDGAGRFSLIEQEIRKESYNNSEIMNDQDDPTVQTEVLPQTLTAQDDIDNVPKTDKDSTIRDIVSNTVSNTIEPNQTIQSDNNAFKVAVPAENGVTIDEFTRLTTTKSGDMIMELDEKTIELLNANTKTNPNLFVSLKKTSSGHDLVEFNNCECELSGSRRILVTRTNSGNLLMEVHKNLINTIQPGFIQDNNNIEYMKSSVSVGLKKKNGDNYSSAVSDKSSTELLDTLDSKDQTKFSKRRPKQRSCMYKSDSIVDHLQVQESSISTKKSEKQSDYHRCKRQNSGTSKKGNQEITENKTRDRSPSDTVTVSKIIIEISNTRSVITEKKYPTTESKEKTNQQTGLDVLSKSLEKTRMQCDVDSAQCKCDVTQEDLIKYLECQLEKGNKYVTVEIVCENGTMTNLKTELTRTMSGNISLDVRNMLTIGDISDRSQENPISLVRTYSGVLKLNLGSKNNTPNAVLKRTSSGGIYVVLKEPISQSLLSPDNKNNLMRQTPNFYPVKVKAVKHNITEPPAVLKTTDSGNYIFVLEKEFEKRYRQTINDFIGDEDECLINLAKTESNNYIIEFEESTEHFDNTQSALLRKSLSGNVKILVNGKAYETMEQFKLASKRSSKGFEELLNSLPPLKSNKQNSNNSNKSKVLGKQSCSDSQLYRKVKLKMDASDKLSQPSALLKKTSSGQYALVLNKESKKSFINNLKCYLTRSGSISSATSGEITISLNNNHQNEGQNGCLKITPSGNMFIFVDDKIVQKVSKCSTNITGHIPKSTINPNDISVSTSQEEFPYSSCCCDESCMYEELSQDAKDWLLNTENCLKDKQVFPNEMKEVSSGIQFRTEKMYDPMKHNCSSPKRSNIFKSKQKSKTKECKCNPTLDKSPRNTEQCFYVVDAVCPKYERLCYKSSISDSSKTGEPNKVSDNVNEYGLARNHKRNKTAKTAYSNLDNLESLPLQLPIFFRDLIYM